MRILLLTHYFEPENGAPQRRWAALIERFVGAGHVVDVLAPPPHYPTGRVRTEHRHLRAGTSHVSDSGGRVRRVRYLRHSGDLITRTLDHAAAAADSYREAARAIRRGSPPDVVIATAPALESLIAGRLLAQRFRLPLVAEMRDAWPDLVAHTPGLVSPNGPTALLKRIVHGFVTRLQRRADAVVTTTATFAAVLERRGIERVRVLRNGTDLQRYRVVDAGTSWDHTSLRILYIGTIGRSQGLDVLIRAAARLEADGTEVEVRIAGQGADVGRLRRLNQRLGAPVEILGQIDGHAVIDQYRWADTTVVSLRDWEPFAWTVPSKLYELLAAGKHITGIVAGEAAEILRDARAGHVVPPGDVEALRQLWARLAADRTLLEIDGTGRAWVQGNADYDRIAQQYLDLLDDVTAHRR